jgi:hypothetical protein
MNWILITAIYLIVGGSLGTIRAFGQRDTATGVVVMLFALFHFVLAYHIWP